MGIKIDLPKSWEEVTLDQFKRINSMKKIENAVDLNVEIEIISILSGMEVDVLNTITLSDIRKVNEALSWIHELPSAKMIDRFTLNKKTYYVNYKVSDLQLSQYIDLCQYTKNKEDIIGNMNKLLSIFVSLKGQEYTIANCEKNMTEFDELPVSIAYPLVVFFCKLYRDFAEAIRNYLDSETKVQMTELRELLNREGIYFQSDGSGSSYLIE